MSSSSMDSGVEDLVLTGLGSCWPENPDDTVFLGAWCFSNNDKYKFLDSENFTVADAPWSKQNYLRHLQRSSTYLENLSRRFSESLSTFLNDHYGIENSPQFWERVLSGWLELWLTLVFDRYLHLARFSKENINQKFKARASNQPFDGKWLVDAEALNKIFYSHEYNFMLYSEILEHAGFKNIETIPDIDVGMPEMLAEVGLLAKEKRHFLSDFKFRTPEFLKSIGRKILGRPGLISSVAHVSMYDRMSMEEQAEIVQSVGAYAEFDKKAAQKVKGKALIRHKLKKHIKSNILPQNIFENILIELLPTHIPDSFFQMSLQSQRSRPDIYIGMGVGLPEIENIENGGESLVAQHGGGYGHYSVFPKGYQEYELMSGFISWGWKDIPNGKGVFYNLPDPRLTRRPASKPEVDEIIMISTMHPAYNYRLHSALMAHHCAEYLKQKVCFMNALSRECISKIVFRVYINDYGFNEIETIKEQTNCNQFFLEQEGVFERFAAAKLIVVDHLATSIIDVFVMNCPTICFWDPEIFTEHENARPAFEMLRNSGILFDSPEAAAEKINQDWSTILDWWTSPAVQAARNNFCKLYGQTDPAWKEVWAEFQKEKARPYLAK